GFFAFSLVVFWVLLANDAARAVSAKAFFIWSSVFNLFVVSVFWSVMVDHFTPEQAKRLFGAIAAGGTLGTLAGSGATAGLAEALGEANLLLASAALLVISIACISGLLKLEKGRNAEKGLALPGPIGGSFYAGLKDILTTPFLSGIAGFYLLFTLTSTFLYFLQADIVSTAFTSSAERMRVFAVMDFSVSALTVAIQLFLTARIIRRIGVAGAMVFLPLVTVAAFALLALFPVLAILIAIQVVRRAANFAITQPGREALFTLLSREQKYKAKNAIDTVVYRGGDAASGWVFAFLSQTLGLAMPAIAAIAIPVSIAWGALSFALGRKADADPTPKILPKGTTVENSSVA
ncbi:MAG TPA: hypothetical protein VD713_02360, partial [Sphingomonadales bacterium]|nr:hypothetical protein [Sphingomonadales bacterium]